MPRFLPGMGQIEGNAFGTTTKLGGKIGVIPEEFSSDTHLQFLVNCLCSGQFLLRTPLFAIQIKIRQLGTRRCRKNLNHGTAGFIAQVRVSRPVD